MSEPPTDGRRLLTGWGRTAPSAAFVVEPGTVDELARGLDDPPARGVLARGLGRSYGDSAQNAGGRVIETVNVRGVLDLDRERGRVRALAGTSLDDLMRWLVPEGWFLPVSPGTRYVTVGGAIANDIHGKNHHVRGSWGNHVRSLRLHTPAHGLREVGPDHDADVYWATAGGLGLTGVILDATFDLHPIETSRLLVDTIRTNDLDEAMDLMERSDAAYEYSVAWIDLTATGSKLGRSVLDRGRFARRDELPARLRAAPLAYDAHPIVAAPPVAPPGLLNPATIRAFNEVWYRKAPKRREGHLRRIAPFFHPLDMVRGWNTVYGPHGFLQWQFVVPTGAETTLRRIVEQLATTGHGSGVTVLKRFGPANPGPLSFPIEGWTLTVDFAATSAGLATLLDRLDDQVAEAGGRVYFAKDSRLRPELVGVMYPRLAEWQAVRACVDPARILQSDLGRRLRIS